MCPPRSPTVSQSALHAATKAINVACPINFAPTPGRKTHFKCDRHVFGGRGAIALYDCAANQFSQTLAGSLRLFKQQAVLIIGQRYLRSVAHDVMLHHFICNELTDRLFERDAPRQTGRRA